MQFINLIMIFDFIHVLHLNRSYSTKNYYYFYTYYIYCETEINYEIFCIS
jgi:hypothetical protein